MRAAAALCLALLQAGFAAAEAPDASIRPEPRAALAAALPGAEAVAATRPVGGGAEEDPIRTVATASDAGAGARATRNREAAAVRPVARQAGAVTMPPVPALPATPDTGKVAATSAPGAGVPVGAAAPPVARDNAALTPPENAVRPRPRSPDLPATSEAAMTSAPAAGSPVAALAPPEDAVRPRPRPRDRGEAARTPAVAASTMGIVAGVRPAPGDYLNAVDATRHAPAVLSVRPSPRPADRSRPTNPARGVEVVQVVSTAAVTRSPRPALRPENLRRRSVVRASGLVPTQPTPRAITGRRGSVCGVRTIKGEALAPIAGRLQGCGVDQPVRITEVAGVRLTTPATMDCTTAVALEDWVSDAVVPGIGRLGGGVASLQVFAHYSCRTRNNQSGARISEHGRGRAIDIGAINLLNGASITILNGWRDPEMSRILHDLHRAACGRFGTVLGPESDRFHQNHFHLDTARYRSGAYCR